jgi:hypothetical protein
MKFSLAAALRACTIRARPMKSFVNARRHPGCRIQKGPEPQAARKTGKQAGGRIALGMLETWHGIRSGDWAGLDNPWARRHDELQGDRTPNQRIRKNCLGWDRLSRPRDASRHTESPFVIFPID